MNSTKTKLITLLQNACAGERAAGFAYEGHGLSVKDPTEKLELKKIEQEEWEHRNCLIKMLSELGSGPRKAREILMWIVGRSISFFCRLGGVLNVGNFGWFMAMYGAGRLERGNIVEYVVAAQYARQCGYEHLIDQLLEMAEIEWDHEFYFRKKSLESKWSRVLKIWSPPPSRESIRQRFEVNDIVTQKA